MHITSANQLLIPHLPFAPYSGRRETRVCEARRLARGLVSFGGIINASKNHKPIIDPASPLRPVLGEKGSGDEGLHLHARVIFA